MALKTYLGPYDSVNVSVAGNDFGVVEKGTALVVPDDLAASVAWPEDNWADGAPKKETATARERAGEGMKTGSPAAPAGEINSQNTDK